MKKILISLIVLMNTSFCYGQSHKYPFTEAQRDSILYNICINLHNIEVETKLPETYKLYKTENIYTFLELNTLTGQIFQIQWSLDEDKEGSVIINRTDLSSIFYKPGAFELYPTQNMYQFILLDKFSGKTWHVQWGMESVKRWIRPID